MSFEKKIAALMFLDVKDYSTLTNVQLESLRREVFRKVDRWIDAIPYDYQNSWGDAVVVASQDVHKMTKLALRVRDYFKTMKWIELDMPNLAPRIALHAGSVSIEYNAMRQAKGIVGTQVNLAARIEPVTPPGHVWATDNFVLPLKQEYQEMFAWDDLGEIQLAKEWGVKQLYRIRRREGESSALPLLLPNAVLEEKIRGKQKIEKNTIKIPNLSAPSPLPSSSSRGHESPNSLPLPPEDFMGRETKLDALNKKATEGKTKIIGLSGMSGIGKSALAKKMAQDLSGSFPDRNIYLNLLDIAREQIVTHVQTQVIKALCREIFIKQENLQKDYIEILKKKRVLIFLDDIGHVNQLSQLEPPDGCLLILTTTEENPRNHKYTFDRIGPFDEQESANYLSSIIDHSSITKHQIKKLASHCRHLPLPLSIVGKIIKSGMKIEDVFAKMPENCKEDEVIKRSLSLSYGCLAEKEKEYLRGISVFAGAFNAKAVATILNLGETDSKKLLEKFAEMSLIDFDDSQKRYFFHGLVRSFLMGKMKPSEKNNFKACHSKYYKDLLKELNKNFLEGQDKTEDAWKRYQENMVNINVGWQWAAQNYKTDTDASKLCMEYPMAGYDILGVWQPVDICIEWHKTARDAAKKSNDPQSEGRHLGLIGVNYRLKGTPQESIKLLEEALQITKGAGDRGWEGRHYIDLANAYLVEGCYKDASRYFEEALVAFRHNDDKKGCAIAYNGLAKVFVNLGQPSLAKCPSEQALYFSREIGDPRLEGKALFNQGMIRRHLGYPNQALDIHNKALKKFKAMRDRRWIGITLTAIGRAKIDLRNYDEAIQDLEQALNIFSDIRDKTWEGKVKGNLGIAYRDNKDTKKAILLFNESIELAKKTNDRRREAIHLNNLGRAYKKEKKFDEAEDFYKQALTIAKEIKDRRRECGVLGDLGWLYFSRTDKPANVAEAKGNAEKALEIAKDIEDKRKEIGNHRTLSRIYEKESNFDKAIDYIKKAIAVGGEIGIPYLQNLIEEGEHLIKLQTTKKKK